MPDFTGIGKEIHDEASSHLTEKQKQLLLQGEQVELKVPVNDLVRRKYLRKLHEIRHRNIIAYYSAWLMKPDLAQHCSISDSDMSGFMNAVHGMDRSKGLDLILHTPGGDVHAAESIINYLRELFGDNIEVFVPHLAMSSGTIVACCGRKIFMGRQSSLGPIDPFLGGYSALAILEEFDDARDAVKKNTNETPLWQMIVNKYRPTIIGECRHAIKLAKEIVTQSLSLAMFNGDKDPEKTATEVADKLGDIGFNPKDRKIRSHGRHLPRKFCREIGLVVEDLEEDDDLQDVVLSIHHAFTHTFLQAPVVKGIENHMEKALFEKANVRNG